MRVVSSLFLVLAVACSSAYGDALTYAVQLDKTTYSQGETATWTVLATASDIQGTNLGVGTLSVNLNDSGGHTLPAGTVSSQFGDYTLSSGGFPGGAGALNAVGAGLLAYNAAQIELGPDSRGPTPLASGTFTASNIGDWVFRGIGQPAQFFSSTTSQTPYASASGTSFSYSVVPEPSSMILGLLGSVVAVGYGIRRRRSAKKAQID